MIHFFSSLFFLLADHRRYSVSRYFFLLYFVSAAASFFVGRQHMWDVETVIYVIFVCFFTCLLLYSYNGFSNLSSFNFSDIDTVKLRKIERITTFLGCCSLIVYFYIVYNVFGFLTSDTINVEDFKNQDGAADFFSALVPHIFITIGYLIAPFGYFFLFLHFYYLLHGNYKKCLLFLFLSLLLVLSGLIALSRSSTIEFILVYSGLLFFVLPVINKKAKRKILKYVGISGVSILFLLFIISSSRFSVFYSKNSKNDAILDEKEQPLVFSTLDYFSMWQENSAEYLKERKEGQIFYGLYNSCGLGIQVLKQIYGNDYINNKLEKEINDKLGDISYSFHGPIARLVYDFGYIGTPLFVFFFFLICRNLSPCNGILRAKNLLFLPVLLPIGAVFFVGNALSSLTYDLGIIYNIILFKILKK